MVHITLGPTQYDLISGLREDHFDIAFYIGGRGSGKSTMLGFLSYLLTRLPYSVVLMTAPVTDTLNNSTLPGVFEAWDLLGLEEGIDYVIGTVPKEWGIKPFHKLRKYRCITWRNGSVILLDGSDNYNKHRGIELDAVLIDEIAQLKSGALQVYIGGLRGKATKRAGKRPKLVGVGNPPADPYQIEQWKGKVGIKVFLAPTHENAANLPPDYIERMANSFSALDYDREVLGKLIAVGGLAACHAFTHEIYPDGNYCSAEFDPLATTYMTWDFNSSMTRPMSTFLVQELHIPIGLDDRGRPRTVMLEVVVKEFVNEGTNTATQCQIIYDWLKKKRFRGQLHIRGDATGEDAARGSAATQSDFEWIRQTFQGTGPWTYKGKKARRTKRVKNRMAALNWRFRSKAGEINLVVNPKRAPRLIESIKQLKWANNNYELEDNAFKDPVDSLSYKVYTDNPVHFRPPRKTKIR